MMRILSFIFFAVFLTTGCSNTWQGIKDDAHEAKVWTKEKLNNGASYVKEKTE